MVGTSWTRATSSLTSSPGFRDTKRDSVVPPARASILYSPGGMCGNDTWPVPRATSRNSPSVTTISTFVSPALTSSRQLAATAGSITLELDIAPLPSYLEQSAAREHRPVLGVGEHDLVDAVLEGDLPCNAGHGIAGLDRAARVVDQNQAAGLPRRHVDGDRVLGPSGG